MTSSANGRPFAAEAPVQSERHLDAVDRRMQEDGLRPHRFELHPHRLEIRREEALLIAAGACAVRTHTPDLAMLFGIGYDTLVKALNGSRVLQFDVVGAMKWASRRVPEAKEWCIAVARQLLPDGWTLTPPPDQTDLIDLFDEVNQRAAQAVGHAMHAMRDGRIDADEARTLLIDVTPLRMRVVGLEAGLSCRANQPMCEERKAA